MRRGVLHTPPCPPRQRRESSRVNLSSCRMGRGVLHTPPRPPRQERESQRMVLSSFQQGRGVLHTPPNPPRQGRESPRVALPDSCRLKVRGYIFDSHPFRVRKSSRMVLSSFRMGRGVLHTPPRPPRQGQESQRAALSDSCRLRVRGYIFESHPFRGWESGADRPSINQREYRGVTTHEGRTDGSAHCTPIRDRYTLRGRRMGSPLSNQCYLFNSWSMFST